MDWFRDRRVLDIGCGDGILDLLITTKFSPKILIGIDIDQKMINKAIKNLQKITNDAEQTELVYQQLKKNKEESSKDDHEMVDIQ